MRFSDGNNWGMPRHFTVAGLIEHISAYISAGYVLTGFETPHVPQHYALLLRHDIDLDMTAATEVAEAEHDSGIWSTFFILMTSPLYNPQSRVIGQQIRHIRALGHRIGLHYDPSTIEATELRDHTHTIKSQCMELERISDGPIAAFSAHRPTANGVELPDQVSNLSNAYAPNFRDHIEYSSDSGGWWQFGLFSESAAFREGRSLQLVLHPIWWTSHTVEHPRNRLQRLIDDRRWLDRNHISDDISPYAADLALPTNGKARWPIEPTEIRP